MTNGTGLTGRATTLHANHHVKLPAEFSQIEGLSNDHACRLASKKLIQWTRIDHDIAAAGAR